jgi:hypothetical protein
MTAKQLDSAATAAQLLLQFIKTICDLTEEHTVSEADAARLVREFADESFLGLYDAILQVEEQLFAVRCGRIQFEGFTAPTAHHIAVEMFHQLAATVPLQHQTVWPYVGEVLQEIAIENAKAKSNLPNAAPCEPAAAGPPINADWQEKFMRTTKRASKLRSIMEILKAANGEWVGFDVLAQNVWNDSTTLDGTVRQAIHRLCKKLQRVGAPFDISCNNERAKLFFKIMSET